MSVGVSEACSNRSMSKPAYSAFTTGKKSPNHVTGRKQNQFRSANHQQMNRNLKSREANLEEMIYGMEHEILTLKDSLKKATDETK